MSFIDDLEQYLSAYTDPFYFFSSKVKRRYSDVAYTPNDALIFGSETAGLPAHLLERWPERCVTLPMVAGARCLNLATTAGIAIYEAWRQQNYL